MRDDSKLISNKCINDSAQSGADGGQIKVDKLRGSSSVHMYLFYVLPESQYLSRTNIPFHDRITSFILVRDAAVGLIDI
jgi:hypothetical protein